MPEEFDREQRPVARYACDRCGVGNLHGRLGWRCDVCRLGHLIDRFPSILAGTKRPPDLRGEPDA
jgi:hypothetical protein